MDELTKTAKHYNKHASKRDHWMKKNKYYHQNIQRLFKFLVPKHLHILEIGCGTGNLLNSLHPQKGIGIDISDSMIEIAQKKFPHLDFRVMDIEKNNFEMNETFDVIILSDLIGDLSDIWKAFRNIRKVCKPQTRVIINYYNYLWEPVLRTADSLGLKTPQPYQNWLSLNDIENLLYLNGFQIIKNGQKQLCPKYIPLLSNFLNTYLSQLPLIKKLCLTQFVIAKYQKPEVTIDKSVSVIIPTQNHKDYIEKSLQRIPQLGMSTEIIFVDRHSSDGTIQEIRRLMEHYQNLDIKLLIQEGKGKGDAIRKGFRAAQGDVLIILDADLTVPPEDLDKFYYALIEDKGQFVNGTRLVYPMPKQALRFLDLLGNKFFSMMFSWLLNQKIKDTLCSTKVLSREDYEKISQNRNYFGDFDSQGDFDLLFGAAKQNLKIIEIPIRYQEKAYGTTSISRFRRGWLLLKMCLFAMKKIKFIK